MSVGQAGLLDAGRHGALEAACEHQEQAGVENKIRDRSERCGGRARQVESAGRKLGAWGAAVRVLSGWPRRLQPLTRAHSRVEPQAPAVE